MLLLVTLLALAQDPAPVAPAEPVPAAAPAAPVEVPAPAPPAAPVVEAVVAPAQVDEDHLWSTAIAGVVGLVVGLLSLRLRSFVERFLPRK